MTIKRSIISAVKSVYRLEWAGIHGVTHWSKVRLNGIRLAKLNGANVKVVEHFAFLHDSCRFADGKDVDHGPRAAMFVEYLASRKALDLSKDEVSLLIEAINGHTTGMNHPDITVGTCWDADRLDLTRVAITPDEKYMSTVHGKELARAMLCKS